MPEYEFDPLPGFPRPQTAIRLAGYYAYQAAHDYWGPRDWPKGNPPFETLFHQAMVWTAGGLLGIERPPMLQNFSPYESDIGMGPGDRDLFIRQADL